MKGSASKEALTGMMVSKHQSLKSSQTEKTSVVSADTYDVVRKKRTRTKPWVTSL